MKICLQASGMITLGVCLCLAAPAASYRSPSALVISPDGTRLYISDQTAGCVRILDAATGNRLGETSVPGEPRGEVLSTDRQPPLRHAAEVKLDRPH